MVIVLFDGKTRQNLYPLTQTKAVADLRFGIFTIKERWEAISGLPVYIKTQDYLSVLYEAIPQDEYLLIDASLKDDDTLRSQILLLQPNEALIDEYGFIAGRTTKNITAFNIDDVPDDFFEKIIVTEIAQRLQFPWQIVFFNDEQLRKDFLLLFARTTTQPISETNKVIQPENIIVEEGVVIEHCIINASTGPVYIGKNATVMEGSILRGPIAICENAIVKMGAKIYGATTISHHCVVGGEIKNSVIHAYSNKAHDGYLGDAVVGRWCNLGSGTSNSNVKNSAAEINMQDHILNEAVSVGKKFGFVMGDYSRTAINTSINSGSVIGVSCNVFGEGLTPKNIKSFSWGIKNNSDYEFVKAIMHIKNWKKMKGLGLSDEEVGVLKHIFERKG